MQHPSVFGLNEIAKHNYLVAGQYASSGLSQQMVPVPHQIAPIELAKLPTFVPETGRVNEWKITLPEELWKSAREKVAERKDTLKAE